MQSLENIGSEFATPKQGKGFIFAITTVEMSVTSRLVCPILGEELSFTFTIGQSSVLT
jgi:hypothetical protein